MILIPDKLYEALPKIYLAAGILVIAWLRNGLGFFSGALLIVTAFLIFQMRKAYRKKATPQQIFHRHAKPAGTDTPPQGFVKLIWQPWFECGHPLIDTQHRHLFDLGNDLLDALLAKRPKAEVEELLESLRKDVTEHFRTEEMMLDKEKNPLTDEHKAAHIKLLARTNVMIDKYHNDNLYVGDLISFFAYEIVATHISKEDTLLSSR